MNDDNELERKLELLARMTEIATELGWYIAVPPDDHTEGLIMGTINFISRYDDLLPEEHKLDILSHETYGDDGKLVH